MKKSLLLSALLAGIFLTSGHAVAGGKRDGASCHTHKSCRSGVCARIHPQDKFGECCTQQDCASLNRQCGFAADNCGVPLDCGSCGPGFGCESFQCVLLTTTTTSSTTSTTSTTSSTTSTTTTSTTTTTVPPTTTTTTPPTTSTTLSASLRSCAGYCGQARTVPPGTGPDCYCDSLACSYNNNDGCPDFYPTCDVSPTWTCD